MATTKEGKILILGIHVAKDPHSPNQHIGVEDGTNERLQLELINLAEKYPDQHKVAYLLYMNGPFKKRYDTDANNHETIREIGYPLKLSPEQEVINKFDLPDDFKDDLMDYLYDDEKTDQLTVYLFMSTWSKSKRLCEAASGAAVANIVADLGILQNFAKVQVNLEACNIGFFHGGEIAKDFRNALADASPKAKLEVRIPNYAVFIQEYTGNKLYSMLRSEWEMSLWSEMDEEQQAKHKSIYRLLPDRTWQESLGRSANADKLVPAQRAIPAKETSREKTEAFLLEKWGIGKEDLTFIPKPALNVWKTAFAGEVVGEDGDLRYVVRTTDSSSGPRQLPDVKIAEMRASDFGSGGGVGQRFAVPNLARRGETVQLSGEVIEPQTPDPMDKAIKAQPDTPTANIAEAQPVNTGGSIERQLAAKLKTTEDLIDIIDVTQLETEVKAAVTAFDSTNIYLRQLDPPTLPEHAIISLSIDEFQRHFPNARENQLFTIENRYGSELRISRFPHYQYLGRKGTPPHAHIFAFDRKEKLDEKWEQLPAKLKEEWGELREEIVPAHIAALTKWQEQLSTLEGLKDDPELLALQQEISTSRTSIESHQTTLQKSFDMNALPSIRKHMRQEKARYCSMDQTINQLEWRDPVFRKGSEDEVRHLLNPHMEALTGWHDQLNNFPALRQGRDKDLASVLRDVTNSIKYLAPYQHKLQPPQQVANRGELYMAKSSTTMDIERHTRIETAQEVAKLEKREVATLERGQSMIAQKLDATDRELQEQQAMFDQILPMVRELPLAQTLQELLLKQRQSFQALQPQDRKSMDVPQIVKTNTTLSDMKKQRDHQVQPQLLQLAQLARRELSQALDEVRESRGQLEREERQRLMPIEMERRAVEDQRRNLLNLLQELNEAQQRVARLKGDEGAKQAPYTQAEPATAEEQAEHSRAETPVIDVADTSDPEQSAPVQAAIRSWLNKSSTSTNHVIDNSLVRQRARALPFDKVGKFYLFEPGHDGQHDPTSFIALTSEELQRTRLKGGGLIKKLEEIMGENKRVGRGAASRSIWLEADMLVQRQEQTAQTSRQHTPEQERGRPVSATESRNDPLTSPPSPGRAGERSGR